MKSNMRLVKRLTSLCTIGLVYQAAGCALDPQTIGFELAASFLALLVSTFVNNIFGVTGGFFF